MLNPSRPQRSPDHNCSPVYFSRSLWRSVQLFRSQWELLAWPEWQLAVKKLCLPIINNAIRRKSCICTSYTFFPLILVNTLQGGEYNQHSVVTQSRTQRNKHRGRSHTPERPCPSTSCLSSRVSHVIHASYAISSWRLEWSESHTPQVQPLPKWDLQGAKLPTSIQSSSSTHSCTVSDAQAASQVYVQTLPWITRATCQTINIHLSHWYLFPKATTGSIHDRRRWFPSSSSFAGFLSAVTQEMGKRGESNLSDWPRAPQCEGHSKQSFFC